MYVQNVQAEREYTTKKMGVSEKTALICLFFNNVLKCILFYRCRISRIAHVL